MLWTQEIARNGLKVNISEKCKYLVFISCKIESLGQRAWTHEGGLGNLRKIYVRVPTGYANLSRFFFFFCIKKGKRWRKVSFTSDRHEDGWWSRGYVPLVLNLGH